MVNVTKKSLVAEQDVSADVAGVIRLPEITSTEYLQLLESAKGYAQAPTSGFPVGAVVQGNSGTFYLGANLEIKGAALGFTLHAEQSAVNNAYLHGEAGIRQMWVSAAPCGHCRQFLFEMENAADLMINVAGREATTLESLLPQPFGPEDLSVKTTLFSAGAGYKSSPSPEQSTAELARSLIKRSYAPYSNSPSAVLLQTEDRLIGGCYVESAAYNPSLLPLMSALDRFRFQKVDHNRIERVYLVEYEEALISQHSTTAAMLPMVAPQAELEVQNLTR